ncbi:hypothetical protein Fmac_028228 [Flemingia macrophylla]|uniref:EF-hand domain-containing protein n=1 Tax=Flemingia macrophylla TaxID=520843 RepID=A0ABD1L6W5_9FABA
MNGYQDIWLTYFLEFKRVGSLSRPYIKNILEFKLNLKMILAKEELPLKSLAEFLMSSAYLAAERYYILIINENATRRGELGLRHAESDLSLPDGYSRMDSFGDDVLGAFHVAIGETRMAAELEEVFKKFDVNGDGKISALELESIIRSLKQAASEQELKKLIHEVDDDGDG